jgi:DNA-binding NarL/FixJ family response regulator
MMKKSRKTPATGKRKILLVDDHPVVREALTLRIDREPDLTVCAAVGTFEEGLQAIAKHHPDLAIIDLSIPDGHGLDLAKDVHAQHPEIALLIFTMHDDSLYGERALRSGARGYVMKHEKPERILSAIRLLLKGEVVVSPHLAGQLLKSATARKGSGLPSIERLSDRELEILQMIGSGLETKEIAVRLRRGIKTIETHRLRLKEKLSISSNSELIAKAASWVALASSKTIG